VTSSIKDNDKGWTTTASRGRLRGSICKQKGKEKETDGNRSHKKIHEKLRFRRLGCGVVMNWFVRCGHLVWVMISCD